MACPPKWTKAMEKRTSELMTTRMGGAVGTISPGTTLTVTEMKRKMEEARMAIMGTYVQSTQLEDVTREVSRILKEQGERLAQLEQFVNYAADVDPNFKRLSAGFKARDRLGIGPE